MLFMEKMVSVNATKTKIVISSDVDSTLSIVSKHEVERCFLNAEYLAAPSSHLKNIYWSTTTIAGGSIVDLAKYQMYYFHFKVMRPDSECRLAARQITNCRL